MLHIAWIAPLLLLVAYLLSPRHRGEIAERHVRRILKQGLEPSRYTLLNGLRIPSGGGTIEIDHVVVSRYGIFVIDSVRLPGVISGTEVQERWKRRRFGRVLRFDNPVHRNRQQVEALSKVLGIPQRIFHPLVVICGEHEFKGACPANTVKPGQLTRRVRKKGQFLLEPPQVAAALQGIQAAHLNTRDGFIRKKAW